MSQVKYKRVILKISGEALAGDKGTGINPTVIGHLAKEIKSVHDLGVEIGIVCGGGNMWRGETGAKLGMERAQADYMGMLATIMNGLALQDGLEKIGVPTRMQTSIEMRQIAEPYIRRRALRHLEKGRVVIFGGGTGNPYFSTDTTAALRAAEIGAEAMLMAKNGVDGVYDDDPRINPNAKKYDKITYDDIIINNLKVMDLTSCSLCKQNNIPIFVFDFAQKDSIIKILKNENIGTYVGE